MNHNIKILTSTYESNRARLERAKANAERLAEQVHNNALQLEEAWLLHYGVAMNTQYLVTAKFVAKYPQHAFAKDKIGLVRGAGPKGILLVVGKLMLQVEADDIALLKLL